MFTHKLSWSEKIFFLISGMIISTPFPALATSLISNLLIFSFPMFAASLLSVAVVVPLLEEFAKSYPLFYRHCETERSIFTLGFLTGLGFGIAEFLLYIFVLGAHLQSRVPLLFFHAANTSIVGYGIGKKRAFLFYLLAVGLHALNNFSAEIGGLWSYGGFFALLLSYLIAFILYYRTSETVFYDNEHNF